MPPSGFTYVQTNHLSRFLNECLNVLVDENAGSGRTAHEAVAREIDDIDRDYDANTRLPAQTATLQQVRAFYSMLAEDIKGNDVSFKALLVLGRTAVDKFCDQVAAIKIVEEDESSDSPPVVKHYGHAS